MTIGYSPYVKHYASVFGDVITQIFVVTCRSMRNPQNGRRHPSQALLDATAYIGEIWEVAKIWNAISAYAIDLGLG